MPTPHHQPNRLPGKALYRKFLASAAISAALLMISVCVPGLLVLKDMVIREAERDAVELAEGLSACELAPYIAEVQPGDGLTFPADELEEVQEELEEFLGPFGVLRTRILDRELTVVFADERELVGTAAPADERFVAALSGRTGSQLETGPAIPTGPEGNAISGALVCTRTPLYGTTGEVIGILELHKDVDPLIAAGKRTAILLILGLVSALMVGMTSLVLLVRQATRQTDQAAAKEDAALAQAAQSQRFLQRVIDSLPLELIVVDPRRRVLLANRMVRERSEAGDDLAGQSCHLASRGNCGETCSGGAPCPLGEVLASGLICHLETEETDSEGNPRHLEVICNPVLDEQGNVQQIIRLARDVSQRRQSELALAAKNQELLAANRDLEEARRKATVLADEAQAANRAKSAFLANMSHEIRTPLTSVLGYADLLSDADVTAPQRDEYLGMVRRNGRHLLELIEDLLDLARIESEGFVAESKPVPLGALVREVADLMAVRARQKGLALATRIPADLPALVLTDPTRIRQALVNLVGNAVKFTDEGSVTVGVGWAAADEDRCKIEFTVRDTGIGIDPAHHAGIFQSFRQVDAAVTRTRGGTGLGLTIVRRVAEMLGGRITLESAPGAGSTFTLAVEVLLPRGQAAAPQTDAAPSPSPAGNAPDGGLPPLAGLRVLLAEDARDNQVLITTILKKAGAAVTLAVNGQEALDLAREREFDLVLMDWQMPVMDGLEATRILRAEGHALPILALTANAMEQDRQAALAAGCDDFLTKPVNRRKILERVAAHASSTASIPG